MLERDLDAIAERVYHRIRNSSVRAILHRSDDTQPTQLHQTEGYAGEIRDGAHRYGEFGFSSMPLPGAKAQVSYQGGWRGFATITGVEDPRYRPTGLKPGEHLLWIVDGAQQDGTGGTTRSILKAALGWVATLFGKTINIGDQNDTDALNLSGGKITLDAASGDIKITVAEGQHVILSAGGAAQAVRLADGSASTVLRAE